MAFVTLRHVGICTEPCNIYAIFVNNKQRMLGSARHPYVNKKGE